MSDQRDLPEGVLDANPAGAWEDGATSDTETSESTADSIHAASLTDSGLPPNTPMPESATGDEVVGDGPAAPADPDGSIEDAAATRGLGPDMRTDEEAEENA
jgi:hypothetical protein